MRVAYKAIRVDVPIGISIYKNDWDSKKECAIERYITKSGNQTERAVNNNGVTGSSINATLAEYRVYAHEIFKAFEVQNTIPSPADLKKAITKSVAARIVDISGTKIVKISMAEAFLQFKTENGAKNSWTQATYEKFDSLWVDLTAFKNDIAFKDLNESGLTDFVTYLRERKVIVEAKKDDEGKIIKPAVVGVKNSTIEKKLGFLNWFLNWSTEKGYDVVQDYKTFRPKLKTTQATIIFLTQDEIKKLCDYTIPNNKAHLEVTRDVFVFCCFTGLRYSDVRNLRRGDVKDDFFDITTIKTADSLRIEFNSISREILEKYKKKYKLYTKLGDRALPVISNQKFNEELKELCMLAGIDEEIRKTYYKGNERIDERRPKYEFVSSHTGRKSFICNALALGIPAEVVMKWTGHADYKSMKPYIAVADEIKAREMAKFNAADIKIG